MASAVLARAAAEKDGVIAEDDVGDTICLRRPAKAAMPLTAPAMRTAKGEASQEQQGRRLGDADEHQVSSRRLRRTSQDLRRQHATAAAALDIGQGLCQQSESVRVEWSLRGGFAPADVPLAAVQRSPLLPCSSRARSWWLRERAGFASGRSWPAVTSRGVGFVFVVTPRREW